MSTDKSVFPQEYLQVWDVQVFLFKEIKVWNNPFAFPSRFLLMANIIQE